MSKLAIKGEYPPDWPEINARTCEEVGHRCIRCGHPYRKGEHGTGEFSPCDERCTHGGPLWAGSWGKPIAEMSINADETARDYVMVCRPGHEIFARWRILTVHHFDGDKANCQWWNLLALCQRCHLQIQGRVNPHTPYFLEHSEWAKPYIAGFYAWKYEGRQTTRIGMTVIGEMDRLLALERLA